MSDTVFLKVGDTKPDLEYQLVDADGNAVDLSGASTVAFHMSDEAGSSGSVVVSTTASITTAADGKVKYLWQSADTDTAGTFFGEWQVDWGGSAFETFPDDADIPVKITEEIA